MLIKSVIAILFVSHFSGCVYFRDTESEWREKVTVQPFSGPASEDAELVEWKVMKYETDSGNRISFGLFPGYAEIFDKGTFGGEDGEDGYHGIDQAIVLPFMSIIFPPVSIFTTSVACFVSPFIGYDHELQSASAYGLAGVYKWRDKWGAGGVRMVKIGDSEVVVRHKQDFNPKSSVAPVGKTAAGEKLFFDYPGFHQLLREVNEHDKIAVMFDDGCCAYRIFRPAQHVKDALVFDDIPFGKDEVADLQIKHQLLVRRLKSKIELLYGHRGYKFASDDLKRSLDECCELADAEIQLCHESTKGAIVKIENKKLECKRRLEEAYQCEMARRAKERQLRVARERKAEVNRLATRKLELEKLLGEKNWNEIISICEDELRNSSRECCRSEDATLWNSFLAKANEELEKIREIEKAQRRTEEESRRQKRRQEVESLLKAEKWTQVVALCNEELGRTGDVIYEADKACWRTYRDEAQVELDKVMRAERIKGLREELANLKKELKEIGTFDDEVDRGRRMIGWLKRKSDQTSLQRGRSFLEFKDRYVAIEGVIDDVGDALESLWGENTIYVSLEIEKLDYFSSINVKFLIDNSWRERALQWDKGDKIMLRGYVSSRGDLINDVTIRNAVPVDSSNYGRAREIKSRIDNIEIELL